MSDGMGRELAYLSSHATNRFFIPNWGIQLWKKSPLILMAQNQNDILDMFWRLQCLKDSLLIKGIASIL